MSDEQPSQEATTSDLEREERRLERLRLVTQVWPRTDDFDDLEAGPDEAA